MTLVASVEILLSGSILVPVLVAALWPFQRLRRAMVGLAPWAAAPALTLGIVTLHPATGSTSTSLPAVAMGMELSVDDTGGAFLLVTALLWFLAGAFARSYHIADPHRDRFFGFFALTMAGNLGLTVAADALSFYLFFAVMTFSAYGLVVHGRSNAALRAGRVYIVLALLGEVLLLAGLMTLGAFGGGMGASGLGFEAELAGAWSELDARFRSGATPVAVLLVAGFGVKAGLVPLHLWLPLAHPVAPTAASALLSGAMIKAGLLGWLRFLPGDLLLPGVGGALMVAGVATALYGVLVGLAQDDPKTILAYSSVSQMGSLALGAGILLLTPRAAPAALAAVSIYALHHGVAKGALFLSVGVGDRAPQLHRWLVGITLLPALALAGAPLTSGFLGKGLLKGAVGEVGGRWYAVLDPLLLLAAVGTTLLLGRFIVAWVGRMKATDEKSEERTEGVDPPLLPWGLLVPWGFLILIGLGAPLWLPLAAPPPDGVELPRLGKDASTALLPIILGVTVSLAVLKRPEFLGWLGRLRIPAGDLLHPLTWALRLIPSPSVGGLQDLREPGTSGVAGFLRAASLWLEKQSDRDLGWLRGLSLGFLLMGLTLLFAVAISR